jgi:predicted nucleic-acid-binding Zn-ribbon protein
MRVAFDCAALGSGSARSLERAQPFAFGSVRPSKSSAILPPMAIDPNKPADRDIAERSAMRDKYLRVIEELWTNRPDECPICKSTAWTIADLVQASVRPTVSGEIFGIATHLQTPQVYVYVPVTCLQCGYTLFFHSGVLDIRDAEKVKSRKPLHLPKR